MATQGDPHKVTICHATHSESNPYVEITVDHAAVDGEKKNDHSHHTGPIWYAGAKAAGVDWGDIIPPVPGVNPGQNWADGEAILAAGCDIGQDEEEQTPTPTATPTPKPTSTPEEEDNASLNIRKVDEEGRRLAGAVFTVEGMEGTFTTNVRGFFCITGLENDSVWLVTEIQAPAGYVIAEDASQLVEVDDDGDCNSPDAVFVNTRPGESPSETPSESPSESPSETPSETPTETPSETPSETPREDEEGGNPTPKPRGGKLPDTALPVTPVSPLPSMLAALLVAIGSAGVLVNQLPTGARNRQ